MSVNKVKLLAAGVLAACGLAVSGGAGWVATADAQYVVEKVSPADRVKQLEAELQKAKAEAAKTEAEVARADAVKKADEAKAKADEAIAKLYGEKDKPAKAPKVADDATTATKKNDYLFVAVSPMDQTKFMAMLQKQEDAGWVFSGTTPMEDPKSLVWVFRRAKGGATSTSTLPTGQSYYTFPKSDAPTPAYPVPPTSPAAPTPPPPPTAASFSAKTLDDAVAIEAEIKRLQEKLNAVKKGKPAEVKPPTSEPKSKDPAKSAGDAPKGVWATFQTAGLPLDAEGTAKMLMTLANEKFGNSDVVAMAKGKGEVMVYGDQEVSDWAGRILKALADK